MRLLVLPRYTSIGPSSRMRFFQFFPYLREAGYELDVVPFFYDGYVERLYQDKPALILPVIGSYLKRVHWMLRAHRYDAVWVQKELLPWFTAWGETLFNKLGIPYVVDYDDALYHRYQQLSNPIMRVMLKNKIDYVMRNAQVVVVGNQYLANHALKIGARKIEYLPTVVDTQRYDSVSITRSEPFSIGWIGTPTTVEYLLPIKQFLTTIVERGCQLIVIGAHLPEELSRLPAKLLDWAQEDEVKQIKQFDVGIMPLVDAPFERGKCGYKLIQYMACGLPVVASPVGTNNYIVQHGLNGYLARSNDDWIDSVEMLRKDDELRKAMGLNGRKRVESEFSLQITAPKLIQIFNQIK